MCTARPGKTHPAAPGGEEPIRSEGHGAATGSKQDPRKEETSKDRALSPRTAGRGPSGDTSGRGLEAEGWTQRPLDVPRPHPGLSMACH